ncbi:MAG: D-alanyl-D-alanine carboxypeptidase, partial [Bryobacteraceae bacterium]
MALAAGLVCLLTAAGFGQDTPQGEPWLAARIAKIMERPAFRHASFGIDFYSLDTGQPIYSVNAQKLFTPASTTKLLTEGTALALLGADYRFHTLVYRTGTLNSKGDLKGDLVLVASGDPNLSGRLQRDGKLAFENEDHSYAGSPDTKAVPGDPLQAIRDLAAQVAAKGVKHVEGRVIVDASLFPEGDRELGTGAVISPICVNDNIVDVTLTPAATPGAAPALVVSPETSYVKFINQATTGDAGKQPTVDWGADNAAPDGTHTVTITGTMPAGGPSILYAYHPAQPSRFAEILLTEALREKGI